MQVELCVRFVLNSSHPLDSTTTASMTRPRDDLTAVDTDTETRSEISEESQAALKSLTSYVCVLKKLCSFNKHVYISKRIGCYRVVLGGDEKRKQH